VRLRRLLVLSTGLALLQTGTATPANRPTVVDPQVAGLQVALAAHRFYAGEIDALPGTMTVTAVRSLQRQAGLPVTGIATLETRAALGKLGRPLFGKRVIKPGMVGFDVAVLQFLLAIEGFDVGTLDGRFGPLTQAAVVAYQERARLVPDGVAGPATQARLCPSAGCRSRTLAGSSPSARYRVRAGDTLTAIAARNGTTVAALAAANAIDPDAMLLAGARLRLPAVGMGAGFEAAWPAEDVTPEGVKARIERYAARAGVARSLALAVAWIESGYQANVRSSTGDWGPMQVSPPAWDFVEDVVLRRAVPHTTSGNIRVGILYLRRLLQDFQGDARLAVAAYHQGAASVREHGMLPATVGYVGAVLAVEARS
jgi:peptidoglycan hydrolase-like protein with peptidoglycan-binding domain